MKILNSVAIPRFPKIRGKLSAIRYPCYVEVKLDGEANIYTNGVLVSKSSGKVRSNCPITDTLSQIFDERTILFGELYYGDGKFGDLYKFLSNQKSDDLNFAIFDVYHPTLNGDYEWRRQWLLGMTYDKMLGEHSFLRNEFFNEPVRPRGHTYRTKVKIMPTRYAEDKAHLDILVELSKHRGYEGVVVKNGSSMLYTPHGSLLETQTGWVKVKHKTTCDLKLVMLDPVKERGEVDYKGRNVGVKIPFKYKQHLKVGDIVEIEHQGELSGGSVRHPVFIRKREQKGVSYA